ncbi:MAG: SH3 domain-containing protein [Lachnospiraceae bacterium]|nr:SH3 domain-containing protein [Lachnospiraceae bacterium]
MAANEVEYDEPMEGYIDEPYDGDSMWLRETPGGTAIEQLSAGTLVSVTGHGYDKYNYKWYHITFDGKSGYVNYKYVVLLTDEDTLFESQIADFPDYYKNKLRQIHLMYPHYVFQADFVDTPFTTVISAQYQMERKVEMSNYNSLKAMVKSNYNWETGKWIASEGNWTVASYETVAYYLDPRNFLDTECIYQFMKQSYSDDQTIAGVRKIIAGTFMENPYTPVEGDEDDQSLGGDYAAVIMKAAEVANVSPYVLASTIVQEQGADGSPLTSGTYKGYEGYYNFYNWAASGTTNEDVIKNGLEYAKKRGWNTIYKAIVDGASLYASGYLNNNQDTYYYKDFNVLNGVSQYKHYYASSVYDAYESGKRLKKVFESNSELSLVFRIPVYTDIRDKLYTCPPLNDKRNNYYFMDMSGELSPAFTMYTKKYSLSVSGDTTIYYKVPEGASMTGSKTFELEKGTNTVKVWANSETGYKNSYTITVTASKACTLTFVEGEEPDVTPARKNGDVNGDGKVSALDYVAIKNHIMKTKVITDPENLKAADVNGDGKISSLDYVRVKNIIMGKN